MFTGDNASGMRGSLGVEGIAEGSSMGGYPAAAAAAAAAAGAAAAGGSSAAPSEYSTTPLAVRRVRYARADLGDMGREFLLLDEQMQKLPELPREVVGPEMERAFDRFFETFNLADYAGGKSSSYALSTAHAFTL